MRTRTAGRFVVVVMWLLALTPSALNAQSARERMEARVLELEKQVSTVAQQNRELAAEARTRDAEIVAILKTLATAQAFNAPTAPVPAVDDARKGLAVETPFTSCVNGLSPEAQAALAALTDPKQTETLTKEQAFKLKEQAKQCAKEVICRDKAGADKQECEKNVDEDAKRLALLLRLAAIAFMASGNYKVALALMVAASSMESGDGGGGEGEVDSPEGRGGGTTVDPSDPANPGNGNRPCAWCSATSGYEASGNESELKIKYPDETVTFSMANVRLPDGTTATLVVGRDTIQVNQDKTLSVTYCGNNTTPDPSKFSGTETFVISRRDDEGKSLASNYRGTRSLGGRCAVEPD